MFLQKESFGFQGVGGVESGSKTYVVLEEEAESQNSNSCTLDSSFAGVGGVTN